MPDMLGPGRRILASQPFSVLLGAELLHFGEGKAELRIPIRDELKEQHGFVHGGVISYAADNALTFAGGSVLGVDVVTSEFKINYLRPVQGDSLLARAAVVHRGRTQAVCRCDLFASEQGADRLCATAQGTIAKLATPSEGASQTN
ncbi:MAG: PaaI family thioesterase [Bryobacterales bacterium]|nr:PaaI family thioesterase [Bryobacterales bacterium]